MALEYLFDPKDVGLVAFKASVVEPKHPAAGELIRYWRSKVGPDGSVDQRSIVPREIPHLLPQLFIAEPIEDDWRFRLVGTDLCRRFGKDLTGMTVSGLFKDPDKIDALFESVAISKSPVTLAGCYIGPTIPLDPIEVSFFPIRPSNGKPMMVLGATFFEHVNYQRSSTSAVRMPRLV